ncbi:hypothetical protein [Rhizobium sp. P44RR-XXIV]|uniref:hypothetical protein n=1 Tax=Rhizobium sp. P44RR-XXIV TaxID=1921145 RepID=UPI0010A9CC71|nr:hypothetical protein [Rhizobium sp. P44RR-XXIV]TIX92906.1 hypothetical protein BSK43_003150 [Rhizobium sp. P44RR-XXIV]
MLIPVGVIGDRRSKEILNLVQLPIRKRRVSDKSRRIRRYGRQAGRKRLAGGASAGFDQVVGGRLVSHQVDFRRLIRRDKPYRTWNGTHRHIQYRPINAHFLEVSEHLRSLRFRQFRTVVQPDKLAADFLATDEALLAVNDLILHSVDDPLLIVGRLDLMDSDDSEGADDAPDAGRQHEGAGRKTSATCGIGNSFCPGAPAVGTERLVAWTGLQPGSAHGNGQAALADDLTHFHRGFYIPAR